MARAPEGFHITIKAPKIKITDERGHFLSEAQKQLYQQNRELAFDLQGEVARRIENSILRKQVSSHRLVRVTMDPKNISPANRYFMGVGNEEFLNKSIAKYWRTAEEGTAKTWTKRSFTSLPLQGLWGLNIEGWRGSYRDPWIALGGKTQRSSRAGQEMYHPFRRGKGAALPVFHPKKDTTPMHAYKAVGESPDLSRRNLRIAGNFWNMVLSRGIRPAGRYDA